MSLRTRVLLAIAVVVLATLAIRQLTRMDARFFQPSWRGAVGLARYLAGDYRGAARAYRSHFVAAIQPHRARFDPAWVALVEGDLPRARELAREQVTTGARLRDAWLTLGELALETGQPGEALTWLGEVLHHETDQFDALLLSSVAHARLDAAGAAIDALKRALRHDRVETRYTVFLTTLQTIGDLAARPPGARPACLLAHYHRYLRIFDPAHGRLAVREAEQAIATGDHADDAYLTIGVAHRKRGRRDAALDAFLQAIALNPRNAEARVWAARIYADRGDMVSQYRMLKAAVEAIPGDVYYWNALARVLVTELGDYREARAIGERVLAHRPNDADLWRQLGDIVWNLGQELEALDYFRKAAALEPRNVFLLQRLSGTLAKTGRLDEALVVAERALAMEPTRPSVHMGLGEVYHWQRRYAEARAAYERAVALGWEGPPESFRSLCYLYYQESLFDKAEQCLRRILAADPDDFWAQKQLREVALNRELQGAGAR